MFSLSLFHYVLFFPMCSLHLSHPMSSVSHTTARSPMPFLSVCLSFFKIVIILIRAYHSESEEELLIMIPSVSKGTPAWPELRELGVAWWVKNDNTLRDQCYKKNFCAVFPILHNRLVYFDCGKPGHPSPIFAV